jgi:hypothetical protein
MHVGKIRGRGKTERTESRWQRKQEGKQSSERCRNTAIATTHTSAAAGRISSDGISFDWAIFMQRFRSRYLGEARPVLGMRVRREEEARRIGESSSYLMVELDSKNDYFCR